MMLVRSYAAQSAIEGLGVFAGEFIPKGTMLWGLDPKFDLFITPEVYEALAPHMQDFVRLLQLSASGAARQSVSSIATTASS